MSKHDKDCTDIAIGEAEAFKKAMKKYIDEQVEEGTPPVKAAYFALLLCHAVEDKIHAMIYSESVQEEKRARRLTPLFMT